MGLTIGFATFSTSLKITSNTLVSPNSNTFGVKFSTKQDSLEESVVRASSSSTGVISGDGIISNVGSPTLTNLSATFTTPGQYVEYTVYARNDGEYKAYLNNINFVGEKVCTAGSGVTSSLVEAACRSINMTVTVGEETYNTTTAISGHALDPNKGEKVVVRLSYDVAGARADGSFSIKFGDVTMVYSTLDDSFYVPPVQEPTEETRILNSIMKSVAISDVGIDFSRTDIVPGVYVINSTVNDSNPIYYYRGAVTNNNVLFANKCWKVVRTTETGGVKLIYNGTSTDGKCLGTKPIIGTGVFNTNYNIANDLRYIYADGTDSTIKGVIDIWYENNLASYTSKLEDIPWCMDLSVSSTSGSKIWYGANERNEELPITPSLTCLAEYQLKVSATDLGLKLKYPIALLTADEVTLAGAGNSGYSIDTYLKINNWWWGLSPSYFNGSYAYVFNVGTNGRLSGYGVHHAGGVRPAISLAPGTQLAGGGDGTAERPYVVF